MSINSTPKKIKLAVLPKAILLACLGYSMTSEMVMAEPAVQTQTQQYTLPAGSLDNVLNQFAAAAGVMLTIDGALTQGLSSNGLRGQYSIQDGFSTILAGTDLQVVRQANNRYMLAVKNSADTSLNLPMIKVGCRQICFR